MGLPVDLYSNARYRACANGGVTERYDRFVVVNIPGPFEPADDAPALLLVPGNLRGYAKLVAAVSVNGGWFEKRPEGMIGPMMGGNYAGTSDSRFREAVEKITGRGSEGLVPVHDRYETPADYDRLSR